MSLSSRQWLLALKVYQQRVLDLPVDAFDPQQWSEVGRLFELLERAGHPGMLRHAGACYFRATSYQRAIDCWDRCGGDAQQQHDYYMDNGARRALIPTPNKRNFMDVSADIVERVDPIFYSDPLTAAMKALGMN